MITVFPWHYATTFTKGEKNNIIKLGIILIKTRLNNFDCMKKKIIMN